MNHPRPPQPGGSSAGKLRMRLLAAAAVVLVAGGIGLGFMAGKGYRPARKMATTPKSIVETKQDGPDADLLKAAVEKYEIELAAKDQEIVRLRGQAGKVQGSSEDGGELPPVTGFTSESGSDLRQLRSGISFKSEINIGKGTLASKERVMDDSYTAQYTLNVRVPEPSKTMEDLLGVNPSLTKLLPGLPALVEKAEVSRWYYLLYDNKTNRVKQDALRIGTLLSRHNFYDCETMLNLRDPQTKQKAFLMQADMDVVSDGSDGDRLATMPDAIVSSDNYQPFTSYGWPKKTATANPLVAGWEKRLAATNKSLAQASTTAQKQPLKDLAASLKRGITDMKGRSFLIADYDPFIVIPINLLNATDPFAPKVGDYALVIHGDKVLPAIVGDGGPTFKVGEASLRIAKEINAKSTPLIRPESSLKVTYLVFPNSRDEPKGPPDYDKWQARCTELVKGIGGLGEGVEIHKWEKLLPDPVPPTPPTPPVVAPPAVNPPAGNPAPASGAQPPPAPAKGEPASPAQPKADDKPAGP